MKAFKLRSHMPLDLRARLRPRVLLGLGMQGCNQIAVRLSAIAQVFQGLQRLFQRTQLRQPLPHMLQVGADGGRGSMAVIRLLPVQRQQDAHLVQRHVHGSAHADKAQPVQIGLGIEAIVVFLPHGRCQQALFFVVANIGSRHAGALCRFSYAQCCHGA